jgi:hypothetical protein
MAGAAVVEDCRPGHLGSQHRTDPLVVQVGERGVVERHRRVDHAHEPVPGGVDPSDHLGHGIGVGDIGGVRRGRHAPRGQAAEHVGRLGAVGAPSRDQGKVAGAAVGEPMGGGGTEPAQAARDQVAAVRIEPEGFGSDVDGNRAVLRVEAHDDLADVPGVVEQGERVLDPGGRVHRVRQRPVVAVLQPFGDLGQQQSAVFEPPRVGQHGVEVDDEEGDVAVEGPHGQWLVGVDVTLAEFDEPATGAQCFQAPVDRLPGQRVEDHVDPLALGDPQGLIGEVEGAGVQYVLDAECTQEVALGGAARGGDHGGAHEACALEGGEPDPTGSAVHEHGLAGGDPREAMQRVMGRQECHRHRGGVRETQMVGNPHRGPRRGHRVRGQASPDERAHPVSHRQVVHVVAHGRDGSGAFEAGALVPVRLLGGFGGQEAGRLHDVPVVERRGPHGDHHLAGPRRDAWDPGPQRFVREAGRGDLQGERGVAARLDAGVGGQGALAGHEAAVRGEHDLVLACRRALVVTGRRVRFEQFVCQPVGVGGRVADAFQ